MPQNGDFAARYVAALQEYLHGDRQSAPSYPLGGDGQEVDRAIEDLARVHADALSTVISGIPQGELSSVLMRSATALARAVMARSISETHAGEFDSHWAYSALEQHLAYARSSSTPFALLLVDVDSFRAFNRALGRKTGNEALSIVHGILRSASRQGDLVIRCGGDEFCMILPGACLRGGMMAAERIRSSVESYRFGTGRLTASIGLVGYPADAQTADRLMQLAYEACHMAFLLGGNGIYTPLSVEPEDGERQPRRDVAPAETPDGWPGEAD
jgi:diguanylate cyclase (GGDEF)-like protein